MDNHATGAAGPRGGSFEPRPRRSALRSPLGPVFVTIVIDLLGFGLVLPLLPLYARDYGASHAAVGLILASFSAVQFLVAPLWGRLSDRIGRRPVLLVGLGGSAIAYLVFAAAELAPRPELQLAVLVVSRVAAGLFGGTVTAALAAIADLTPDAERGRGMALVGAAFGIGFFLGPALGGLGHAYLGPGAPGLMAATLSTAALLYAARRLAEPPRRARAATSRRPLHALGRTLARRGVRRLLSLTFLGVLAFGMLESTLALLARERFAGWSPEANGWLFSYFGLCLAVAQGWLVRRWMRKNAEPRLVVGGCVALAAGLLLVGWAPDPFVLAALAPVAVFGSAAIMPSLTSLLSKRADPAHQGEVLGANESIRSLGRIVSHGVGPALLVLGPVAPFVVGAAVAVLAGLLALAWLRPRSGQV